MAIIRRIGEDPKSALVLASKMLAGERHAPEEGGGATLQIGDYVIELTRQELALVAALSIQRPTPITVTMREAADEGPRFYGTRVELVDGEKESDS